MEKPLIMVSSVTYAMKGKQILNNAGIRQKRYDYRLRLQSVRPQKYRRG